jgi:hypothetical protein
MSDTASTEIVDWLKKSNNENHKLLGEKIASESLMNRYLVPNEKGKFNRGVTFIVPSDEDIKKILDDGDEATKLFYKHIIPVDLASFTGTDQFFPFLHLNFGKGTEVSKHASNELSIGGEVVKKVGKSAKAYGSEERRSFSIYKPAKGSFSPKESKSPEKKADYSSIVQTVRGGQKEKSRLTLASRVFTDWVRHMAMDRCESYNPMLQACCHILEALKDKDCYDTVCEHLDLCPTVTFFLLVEPHAEDPQIKEDVFDIIPETVIRYGVDDYLKHFKHSEAQYKDHNEVVDNLRVDITSLKSAHKQLAEAYAEKYSTKASYYMWQDEYRFMLYKACKSVLYLPHDLLRTNASLFDEILKIVNHYKGADVEKELVFIKDSNGDKGKLRALGTFIFSTDLLYQSPHPKSVGEHTDEIDPEFTNNDICKKRSLNMCKVFETQINDTVKSIIDKLKK